MLLPFDDAPKPKSVAPRVQLLNGDCLDVMPTLKAGSMQMVFADLPYGVTANIWDTNINLDLFWDHSKKLISPQGLCVLTATQPFASDLIASNRSKFRYDIIWIKSSPTGFFNARRMPLRSHESILIFYDKRPNYQPQMTIAEKKQGTNLRSTQAGVNNWGKINNKRKPWTETGKRYPLSHLHIKSEIRRSTLHPTQKPVALLEWLILTYTNAGDTVLDPVSGSCTTGVACLRTGRNFVGIEKDAAYFEIGRQRVAEEQARLGFPVTV